MKSKLGFALIFSFFLIQPVHAEIVTADSHISAVTVYSDRAQVTRVAKVQLKPGQQEVVFDGLPGMLEAQSISASGRGKIKVKLFGAAIKTEQLAEAQSETRKNLETQLEKLRDERRALESAKLTLDQRLQFFTSIRAASLDQIGKDLITKIPAAEDMRGVADYLETEFSSYYKRIAENDALLREKDKEIGRVERELQQLYGGNNGMQKIKVAVDLESEAAGDFEIELRYRVAGASWNPFYEARAHTNENEVFWQQYANVRQSTGEDWVNIPIQLSTAEPSLSGQMPETNPWFIQKLEPRPMRSSFRKEMRKAAYEEVDALRQDAAGAPASLAVLTAVNADAPMQQADFATATVQSGGASVEYQLPKKETIQSNGQPVKVSVQALKLPAGFRYQISPRLSAHAYLTAKVTNPSDGILLPGEVHLFQEDSFIGVSAIELIGPQEKFDLNMGVDERIKVEQKVLRAKTDISLVPGLNGKWKTIDYAYLVKLENHHPATVDISVIDQIPVSQHTDIKVEKVESDPKWNEEDKDKPGVTKWHFQMVSQAKKEIKLSYKVKYPESFQVEGL